MVLAGAEDSTSTASETTASSLESTSASSKSRAHRRSVKKITGGASSIFEGGPGERPPQHKFFRAERMRIDSKKFQIFIIFFQNFENFLKYF